MLESTLAIASIMAVLLSVVPLVIKAVAGSMHLGQNIGNVTIEYENKEGKRVVLETDMSDHEEVEKLVQLFTREGLSQLFSPFLFLVISGLPSSS